MPRSRVRGVGVRTGKQGGGRHHLLFVTGIPAPLPGAGGGTRATALRATRSRLLQHRPRTTGAAARPGPGVLLSLSFLFFFLLREEGINFWRDKGEEKMRKPEGERESGVQQVQAGETSPDPRGTAGIPRRAAPRARRAVLAAEHPRGQQVPFIDFQ